MSYRSLWYIVIGISILLFASLGGWYFFLQQRTGNTENVSAGRGFGSNVPTFGGTIGSTLTSVIEGLSATDQTETDAENIRQPRILQISPTPTAGFTFISTAATSTLRFAERSTGYLFEIMREEGTPRRLTNVLIPQMYEAYFASENDLAAFAVEESGDVFAFAGTLGAPTTTSEFLPFSRIPLGKDIRTLAFLGDELFTLVESEQGSLLVKSNVDGTDPESIFLSGIVGWRLLALPEDRIILAENPATNVPSSAYTVDMDDGSLSPLVRRVAGLTILPHPENGALIAGSDNGTLSLAVRADADAPFVTLPIRTIADKCVWAPRVATSSPIAYCAVPTSIDSTHFLDDWYKGIVHTSDDWWRINAATGEAQIFISPETGGFTLDVEHPIVDDEGEYIVFRNARDKSLWRLRINR